MTIIVFLVDTSASMNQRTYSGTTSLDISKGAVENFMKIRSRDPSSRWDRYMLLTFEDPPANVKAGWKESHATFVSELRNLSAGGLSSLGPALKHTFDLLNVNRMQTGIDTYGQGRCPFYLEPAMIICITDGQRLTTSSGVQTELNLPMNQAVPGSELTKEPFRWDQRLFSLVLRLPATPPQENHSMFIPSAEDSPIDVMCEVTGGRSYCITSQRMLSACLESLVQKVQYGVVVNFEKIGPDPPAIGSAESVRNAEGDQNGSKENQDVNRQDGLPSNSLVLQVLKEEQKRSTTPTPTITSWHNCRKLILVPRSAQKGYSVGHWPIPEAFWPDPNSPTLPPRNAHPVVKFTCTPCEPMVIENLPFDKYELEPSPLTQFILERRQPGVAWQVFVGNSAKYSDIGHAFGYLKASTNLQSVNLFVMPYNYPVLLPLLDELMKVHKLKATQKWRQQFDNYLKTMPVYFATPLKRALARIGIHNLVPDNMESCLSYSVISYLKKLKNQAKNEHERLIQSVGQKATVQDGIKVTARSQTSIIQHKDFHQILEHLGHDLSSMSHLKQELNEYNTFTLAVPDKNIKPQEFRNPYDIPRRSLLDQVRRMRANFLLSTTGTIRLQDEDQRHSVPVQQMGNYQEVLKRLPQPLRELETQPARLHTFGNPFKVNKNLMIDEADEAMPGENTKQKRNRSSSISSSDSPPGSPGPRKRKPGPLPKDFPVRRPITPPADAIQPPQSPIPKEVPPDKIKTEQPPDVWLSDQDEGSDNEMVIDETPNEVVNHLDQEEPLTNHVKEEGGAISLPRPRQELDNGQNHMGVNNKKQKIAMEHNAQLKRMIIRELKKPGRKYDNLFQHLHSIQGPLETKRILLHDIIHEAARFKRRTLIQMLKQFEQTVVKTELKKHRTSTPAIEKVAAR